MKITVKELAKLSGYSVGTVSMALNNNPKINEKTRKKIQQLIKEYDYTISQSARRLSTQRSGIIGVLTTNNNNPFFSDLAFELNNCISSTEYTMLLGFSNDDRKLEEKFIRMMVANEVEGLIIVPMDEQQKGEQISYLQARNIPVVMATSTYRGISADSVMTDLEYGEFILVDHLLKTGRRRIAFINGSLQVVHFDMREKGYLQAHEINSVSVDQGLLFESHLNFSSGYDITDRVLEAHPDAIITANDFLAFGVMNRLLELGIDVPGSIAVAGYDDIFLSKLSYKPLTTVRQPVAQIASESLRLLINQINSKKEGNELVENNIYLEPELVLRSTTP